MNPQKENGVDIANNVARWEDKQKWETSQANVRILQKMAEFHKL